MLSRKINGRRIAICSHTTYHRRCLVLEVTVMTESFSRVHIGDVQLNERDINTKQGIPNSDTCVCEGSRIDDNHVNVAACLVDAIDDGALPIGLESIKLDVKSRALRASCFNNVVEGSTAVEMRLSCTEKVQVRAVHEEDAATHSERSVFAAWMRGSRGLENDGLLCRY